MALQVSLSAEQSGIGTPIPQAYARIVAFQWSLSDNRLIFAVEYHWDRAAKAAGARPIGAQTFAIDDFNFTEDLAIKKQLYKFMKTLPAFSGAADV